MEVIGLDGKIYKWNPINNTRDFSSQSTYHTSVRALLKDIYKYDIILEEVDLPGTKTRHNNILRLDFYIPKYRKAIEVHGEQHYNHITFFHADAKEFKLSQLRDTNKSKWCNINNIDLIILSYNETIEVWKEKILCPEKR